MKKLFFLILVFLLFPNNTKAVYEVIDARCTTNLKMSLREEAKDIVHRVSKIDNGNNISYTAYFYNFGENIDIKDANGNYIYNGKLENLKPGTSKIVYFYASSMSYCSGYKIMSKVVEVPYYNPYLNSELCLGYEEFELCSNDINVTVSREEFESERKKYIEKSKVIEEEPDKIVENKFNFIEFINEYKYFFIAGISLISVVSIIILINKKRKNRGVL